MGTTVLSILLAILAYSTLNVGLVLEKKGASELPGIETAGALASVRNFLRNPKWLIGFLLTNVQFVPLFLALRLGSISLVSPMMGVGLVVLVVFSVFYLHEPFDRAMGAGVALTIGGIAILGATNPGDEPVATWRATMDQLCGPTSLAWLGVVALGAIVPAIACVRSGYRRADVAFGVASGCAAALGLVATKLMMAGFGPGEPDSGVAANLARWPFWLFVAVTIGGNGASMVFQQLGFQKGRAIVLTPLFTVGTVVLPAVTGVVAFDEWARFGAGIVAAKVAAIVVLVAGVAVLSVASARTTAR